MLYRHRLWHRIHQSSSYTSVHWSLTGIAGLAASCCPLILTFIQKSVVGSTNDSLVDSHKWFMLLANINVYVSTHWKTYITNIVNEYWTAVHKFTMILLVFFNLFSFWFTFSKKHLKQAKPSHHKNTRRIFNTATLFHDTEMKTCWT